MVRLSGEPLACAWNVLARCGIEPGQRVAIGGIGAAAQGLGYEPRVPFEHGLRELAEWLAEQTTVEDEVVDASRELEARGLTMGGAS
jgi:hypothetical protein